ncbi:MAG: ATP-binding protein [Anaerolineae bacterium]|nr:ATP-binding protein [Anaerolineae bacterium]
MTERTRSDELEALTKIAAQVNCTQDLDEILRGALSVTLDVIGEESGEIMLRNEETGELVLQTYQGVSPEFVADESRIPPGECLCGRAVASRRVLVSTDLALEPARTRSACLREGFHSCIRLPLLVHGEVLGLLSIQSHGHRQFTAADQELLTAIGNQIGIAIANARLIQDAERGQATLHSVMNSLVDGLILVDRHDRITYINPCARDILEIPGLDLLGSTLEALEGEIAARAAQPAAVRVQLREAALQAEGTPAVEVALTHPDAATLQVRFFPIHETGGGHLGLGILLHDITREKELDEMKSRLLSTVSHELRTPLASIKGFATTLLRQDVEWDEATRREFLSIIDTESDRLSELIGNLLDMSRIEAGELAVEAEPVDLLPLLEETAAGFQMMTREHRIMLHVPSHLPLIMADARRTRQVLRNLIENAVKYSLGGGTVTIVVELQDGQVQISVADKGIGIEAYQLERIFDRFYQADSASTRAVGGSGLGLSICKAIVEAQGGEIWAESQVGRGSTFSFTLPLAYLPDSSEE